jgi:hypothetical protein
MNVIVPLVGIALTVMCYYPGYMSDDSIKQLTQARSGHFTDWQLPLMSGVWSGFDALIPGPLGMLIFHNLMFWLGLTLLVRQALARRLWSYPLILAMGFFPPILALLGTIWKDVGMASALLLACSLLFQAQQRQRGLAWCAAQLALFYASGVRHNAVVAVLHCIVGWNHCAASVSTKDAQTGSHWNWGWLDPVRRVESRVMDR